MKLSVKISLAFISASAAGIVLMVGALAYMADRNFSDYIRQREIERLDALKPALIEIYKQENGWAGFKGDLRRWHEILGQAWSGNPDFTIDRLVMPRPLHPAPANDPARPGRPLSDQSLSGPPRSGLSSLDRSGLDQAGRAARLGDLPDGPLSPPWDRLRMVPRVSLLDANKKPVIHRAPLHPLQRDRRPGDKSLPVRPGPPGPPEPTAETHLTPLKVDGKIVGYIGLDPGNAPSHPLDVKFIQRQSRIYYLVGGLILGLSILVALILSRGLTAPIRRLARAAEEVTRRRFDARIKVESSDELGLLARDFNRMAEALGRFEERQKQWLSDISHELRTPLSVLIGEIEALQDGLRPPDRAALDSLHDEADRLQKIVNDLHQLALAESGDWSYRLRPVQPLAVLDRVARSFSGRLDRAGLAMELNLNDSDGPTIQGDPDRLGQVFTNLLENIALHADSPGRAVIEAERQSDRLVIRFHDTGPGVDENDLPRLFDRLFRTDRSRSRSSGGSGLGLAVCRAVIAAHQGTITAKPGPLGGLLVEIELPLK